MKTTLYTIACLLSLSIANAQKLPTVQIIPTRAPANVKIDGKIDEWAR